MIIPLLLSAMLAQQNPAAAAKAAIGKTRASDSYKVSFKSSATVPKSDPVVTEGESVWVNPGVLYIHSKATGGKEQWIIRTGKQVEVYSEEIQEWLDSAEAGHSSAGRGVENPEEMLEVLAAHLDNASWAADKKSVHLAMQGADIAKIAKEQGDQSFDWDKSSATLDLAIGGDGRIASIRCSSQLALKDPKMAGKMADYTAEISVLSYNSDRELKFEAVNPATKKATPVEIPKDLRDKIDAELKRKPEPSKEPKKD